MVRFWPSRGLWKALEEIYLLIATINKCDLSKGRKGRIYFLLAFKTRFTVLCIILYIKFTKYKIDQII